MEQQSRMLTVLACLVFSMCGMSALLSWLDPSLPSGSRAFDPQMIVAQARESVAQSSVVHAKDWHRLAIDAGRVRQGRPLLSAASPASANTMTGQVGSGQVGSNQGRAPQPSRIGWTKSGGETGSWHFLVASDGACVPGEAAAAGYAGVTATDRDSDTLRIYLEIDSHHGQVTVAQAIAARALIASLQESLPLDAAFQVSPAVPQELFQ